MTRPIPHTWIGHNLSGKFVCAQGVIAYEICGKCDNCPAMGKEKLKHVKN